MVLIYRRTGGLFVLLTLATVSVATAVLTVAVAATVVIVALPIAAAVLFARAVLPRSWRPRTVTAATPWPHETIEATAVNPTGSSEEGHLLRVGGDKG